MDSDQFQLGKSKVFIKAPESVSFLRPRLSLRPPSAPSTQRGWFLYFSCASCLKCQFLKEGFPLLRVCVVHAPHPSTFGVLSLDTKLSSQELSLVLISPILGGHCLEVGVCL